VRQREPSDLAIHVREDRSRPLVSVAGELDLASVGLLIAMLHHVRRSLPPRRGVVVALDQVDVDVDLTAVMFADSHGLAPLLDSRTRIVCVYRSPPPPAPAA
jgi:anti-anti-sigma regulatory factor